MRGSQTSALVLIAGLFLGGCGTDTDAARRVVEKVEAPAAGWTSGGPRVSVFASEIERDDGIWVVADYNQDGVDDDDAAYLATWEVVVKPGAEQQRCKEAAEWVRKTGELLPGNLVDTGAKRPDVAGLVLTCVRLLNPLEAGSGSDTGYGGSPSTQKYGYRFFAGLTETTNGSKLSLSVNVEAAPKGNFES